MFNKKNIAPKVSVILLSYNHAAYIAKAIESTLNQTFTDFEFLIADDGSQDNSCEIISTFTDERIKFFPHEINRGPKFTLAECCQIARGKYIAIHHSDDLWESTKLEKQVNFLEENKKYAACFTWVQIIDEDGAPYELAEGNHYHSVFDKENRPREKWLHDLFFVGNCFCHPSVLLRNKKNLYEEIYGVNGLWQLPDYSAWIRLLLKSDLYVLQERLTLFRLRRQKQENTSAENPDTVIRSEMELYRILSEYRKISAPDEFLKIFPEAEKYVVNGKILTQYALAKILQTSQGAARNLLALDILFDLLNDKKTAKKLFDLYGYDEKNFVKENAAFGILYPGQNLRFLQSALYYDTGAGYSEQNKITSTVYVRQDGNFFAEFVLNEKNKIRALRFDPVENEPLVMKIISVKVNNENCSFAAVAPYVEQDSYQIFATYDPQYILNYSGAGEIVLQIQGTVSKNYDALAFMDELRKNTVRENQNLQNQLSDKSAVIQTLQDRLIENGNTIQGLQSQNQNLQNQNQNLQNQLAESNNAVQNLQSQNQNLQNQLAESNNAVQALQNKLNEIYVSRGYKFLQEYYSMRDKLLPKGSMRRLLVKNMAWAVTNPRRAGSLINRQNLSKVMNALKMGGLRQALVRSDAKIHSSAVTEIQQENISPFGNDWLKARENFLPPENLVIDILVPIYNAYEFTKKCIASVYANTDVPFNLYLIDDCSTDERISDLLEEIETLPKNPLMKDLKIFRNAENLGFIGSVNRGFKISKNNVVLLNTDTEVPPNWLSRLIKPMLEDEKIASVTPFSNSAEICSFPNFCQNKDLPEGLTVAELDKIFARYGDLTPCEIPTGVGFCMLMRRECIENFGVFDTIYGKGYGEENDWCRRTAAQGYKHVHIKNLFVWHKHGASFNKLSDKSKQQRINENLAILSKRYPDYHRLVQEYIQKDPAKSNRIFLYHCAKAAAKNFQGVIFLNHSMGGGAKVYQDRLADKLKDNWRVYEMAPLADGVTLSVTNFSDKSLAHVANFDLRDMDSEKFCALLEALQINWIFINQLVTFPLPKVLNWIMRAKIPYTFFGHDFFAVCPRYQLLNSDFEYCGAETNLDKCRKCLKSGITPVVSNIDIEDWRRDFQKFLDGAKEIIVPSSNTQEIFNKYYPAKITVHEHEVVKYLKHTFKAEFATGETLTVAVVGAIGDEKGAKIIYKLADELEKISLPIKLLVIGITNLHNDAYKSATGKFEITGRYDNQEISNLLAEYKAAFVLIPSIWPETYSYTTTEAMYSGYPVMVFPLGAPADRVKKTGGGWILDNISEKSVSKKIIELFNNRNEIVEKAKNLLENC